MAASVRDTVVAAVDESKKKDKKDVDYSKGMKYSHCGICKFFISPDKCQKVKGKIEEGMWCELFHKA